MKASEKMKNSMTLQQEMKQEQAAVPKIKTSFYCDTNASFNAQIKRETRKNVSIDAVLQGSKFNYNNRLKAGFNMINES